MESSEEEDDFPSIESIIPQTKVDSLYQSHTEKVPNFFISHINSFHFPLQNFNFHFLYFFLMFFLFNVAHWIAPFALLHF